MRLDVWESEKQPDQLWQFRSSLRNGHGLSFQGCLLTYCWFVGNGGKRYHINILYPLCTL